MSTRKPATQHFKDFYRKSQQHRLAHKRSASKPEVQARARKRKQDRMSASISKKAKLSYGPGALDVTPDLSDEELKKAKDDFAAQYLTLSKAEIQRLSQDTLDQSTCGLWRQEHRKHLTSSLFGDVMSRKMTTPVTLLVKRILYPSFRGNIHTSHGLAMETIAIEAYELWQAERGVHVKVKKCGMVVCQEHQELAASPDGIVVNIRTKEKGLLEIKNVLKDKKETLHEASKKSTFCLEVLKDSNKLQLRRRHKYFYQCQGLLNVLQYDWLDFVVRADRHGKLHVERIFKDKELWEQSMKPKLLAFYDKCLLPELAAQRYDKCPGIREPSEPWFVAAPTVKVQRRPNVPSNGQQASPARRRQKKDRS